MSLKELDGLWVVYGLVSPRAGWMFYVGTSSCVSRRITHHMSCAAGNATAGTIREMRDAGLKPTHCIFGVFADKASAIALESALIDTIADIVNRTGRHRTKRHIEDKAAPVKAGGPDQVLRESASAKKSGNSRAAEPAVVPRAQSTGRNNKAVAKAVVPAARLNRPDSAGSVKQAVDTIPKPKMGRPRIHPDRRAYLTMKQREYREKKRAAK